MPNGITIAMTIVLLPGAFSSHAAETTATMPTTSATPARLVWSLSESVYPEGIDDEAGYLQEVRERCERYASFASESSNPADAVEYELAGANLILAREIEPFASRRLLDLSRPEDTPSVRSALATARARLDSVGRILARRSAESTVRRDVGSSGTVQFAPAGPRGELASGSQNGPDRAGDERYGEVLRDLQSFTTALEAVWSADQGEAASQAGRIGAAELSVLLEHERPDVASAALLWQAVLYRRIDRLDKAFELLPLTTERIAQDARAYQFCARLLRCRLLADRGGYAAACSLLLQLEERILEWFGTDEARTEAAHAALLVRLQILERWRDALGPANEASEIEWCAKAAERIRSSLTEDGDDIRLLRLEQTVPLLIPMPDVPGPAPTTRPADPAASKSRQGHPVSIVGSRRSRRINAAPSFHTT